MPRHESGKEGGRESDACMVGEEALNAVPEGHGGGGDIAGGGKGEEIIEIGGDPPLHPLGGSLVNHHGLILS